MVQVFDTKYSHYKLIINSITPYCASYYNLNKHKQCLYIYPNVNKSVISQDVTMIVAMQHEKRSKWIASFFFLFLTHLLVPISKSHSLSLPTLLSPVLPSEPPWETSTFSHKTFPNCYCFCFLTARHKQLYFRVWAWPSRNGPITTLGLCFNGGLGVIYQNKRTQASNNDNV